MHNFSVKQRLHLLVLPLYALARLTMEQTSTAIGRRKSYKKITTLAQMFSWINLHGSNYRKDEKDKRQ